MSEPQRLFVYGMLRCGEPGYQSLDLERRTRTLGVGRIAGRLYHLGDYPGLILGKRGIVHGDVLTFDDPALWTMLDAYELYDPDRPGSSEYKRIEVDLIDCGSRAWAYEYNRPLRNRPIIASGNWWTR